MKLLIFPALLVILFVQSSCYRTRASKGGGQVKGTPSRTVNAADVAVPRGYKAEAVASGLTFPSGMTFDEEGRAYVVETGYSYGEVVTEPRLLRLETDGSTKLIAKGDKNGPWTGVAFSNGAFYVCEGGHAEGGRILKISKDGKITPILTDLPSFGDHHTNGPAVRDGYVYFGQGTATNSGVVGTDNADFGWLTRRKDFHDIPCADVILAGRNYTTKNVLTDDPDDEATTGAYLPFNTPSTAGQIVKGAVPCGGAIMRVPVGGGKAELVAWGLRNPFGLAFGPNGQLYITENGFDTRGSRPVWGAGDVLWEIKKDTWYGWPDFSAGAPVNSTKDFKTPGRPKAEPLLQKYPNTPPAPAAILGVHSSSNGLDFAPKGFGYEGEAFIAQFGDMAPMAGKVLNPVGFKVVRVNVNTGVIRDFAVNKGKRHGPATWMKKAGLERPLAVKFDPSGTSLYIIDFGVMKMTEQGPIPHTGTGVIWKITKQ